MGYAWQHLKHGNINTNTFSATTQTLHRIQKSLQSPLKEATDMPQESSYLPLQVFIFTYPPFQNYWHHRLVNTYTHYLWYEYNNPQLWGMMCEFSITRCVWVGGWVVCPGEQNPHRVPKHSDCELDQKANHQPAGSKSCLEVCLPTTLCSQRSSQCGCGVVRRTSSYFVSMPLWPSTRVSFVCLHLKKIKNK